MAIAVPFLMAATGTSAAIGAAVGLSATMVSTIASVAFQVTGINDKINKAASKVFGADLVGFANLAGAAYGAFNGGFDIGGAADAGGAASAIDASTAGSVNGSDFASDSFSVANAQAGGGLVSDGLGGIYNAPGTAGATLQGLSQAGLDGAKQYVPDGGFNLAELGAAPTAETGTNLIAPSQPVGLDSKALASTGNVTEGLNQAASVQPGAAGVDAAGANAAGNQYSLSARGNASAPTQSGGIGLKPPASMPPQAPTGISAKPAGFFEKLLNNEKAMGLAIQGLGQGITAAQANKAQQEALDWQKKKYTSVGNFRVQQ